MNWYYARGQEQVGPITDAEFEDLVTQGVITIHTLVWHEGMEDWQRFYTIPTAAKMQVPPKQTPSPADQGAGDEPLYACSECGRFFESADLLNYDGNFLCVQCKPLYFQRLREGAPLGARYGGFWIRLVASVMDGFIVGVGHVALALVFMATVDFEGMSDATLGVLMLMMQLMQYAWAVAYETWFIGRFGATPGKMLLGLKVVRPDGGKVTYLRAFGRCFGKYLSGIVLGMGYLIAAFDAEKRTLHDHICDTRVIRQ